MRITAAEPTLNARLTAKGWSRRQPPDAGELVEVVLDWYATERVDGVDLDADGDMLLFQWGTYDWGSGPSFQFDITRQLTATEEEDDDAIWQLSVTLHYPVLPESAAVGIGNRWCGRPTAVDGFRSFIKSSTAMSFARARRATRLELTIGLAG